MEDFLKYLEFEKRFSKHTLISYRTDLEQLSQYLATDYQITISEITYPIIRSWMVNLGEGGLSPRSVNRKIACLRSYFKYLMKTGKVTEDPTTSVKGPKIKKKLPQFISENECYQLLENLPFEDDFEGRRDKLILELLYGTGIRLSELIGLKQREVNMYDGTISVIGKGNKQRLVPMNKKLTELIKEYMGKKELQVVNNSKDAFIVTNSGDITYPIFIYRTVKKYLSKITTAEKKSPHILRHSFATHLLEKGADINAIKDLLGHSSLAATQVYTHNTPEKLKAIFDQAHPKS